MVRQGSAAVAPTAKKNAPAIIATVAAKYLLAGVAGVGSPMGQLRICNGNDVTASALRFD